MATDGDQLARAIALHQAGRIGEAEQIYQKILLAAPQHADAWHLLGVVAHQKGQHQAAVELISTAIAFNSNSASYHNNIGEAYRALRRFDEAVASFRRAVGCDPTMVQSRFNLGRGLAALGEGAAAAAELRQAIERDPHHAGALKHLGHACFAQRDFAAAATAYRKALDLAPGDGELHAALGDVALSQGAPDAAVAHYEQAVALGFENAVVLCSLGLALHDAGAFAAAEERYEKALKLDPESALVHNNLGLAKLLRGEFGGGWRAYERRLMLKGQDPMASVERPARWLGEDIEGKRILLYAEQGVGDTVQFARYAPLVVARGATVVMAVHRELHRLLNGMAGIEAIVGDGEVFVHRRCPLLSLPLIFGTDLATIPADIPYLTADSAAVELWRKRFSVRPGLKVGLVWAGTPGHRRDHDRSMTLAALGPLADVPRVSFYSLQKGPAATEVMYPPAGLRLKDLSADLGDFADTAAAISALDLVVTVDTAVAHVAGALGKPVWILLSHVPDWRWLLDRDDSPWYPTARLFRQPTRGAWAPVAERVAEALRRLVDDQTVEEGAGLSLPIA